MTYEYPIVAIHKSGATCEYATLSELHPVRDQIGVKYTHTFLHEDYIDRVVTTGHDWILRDALGATIDPNEIPWPPRDGQTWITHDEIARHAAARGLPIPNTGVFRRSGGGSRSTYMGKNRRIASDKADVAELCEYVPNRFIESATKGRMINGYDRGRRFNQKSWKTNRVTRWKA